MDVVKENTSHNLKTKKKYSRTIYHCKTHDIWLNLEIPKE